MILFLLYTFDYTFEYYGVIAKFSNLEGIYMRFYFGRNEIFQVGVSSIFYNCLHEILQNETHWDCYFTAVKLTEMKFHFGL